MTASDKQTVLIVDNIRANALALARILQLKWNVKIATSGEAALEQAVEYPLPDIILLDVQMPGMNGYEVCARLQNHPQTRDIPVMFVTSASSEENEAYGLELGAVDYLVKPVRAPIVQARVRNHIALRQAQIALAEKNRELERLASRDALTNLFNRWKMNECLEQEISRAERFHRPLSIVLIDIDRFKRINDTYGHPIGDSVLQETAEIIQSDIRNSDIACRWGGEEFLIICPETGLDTSLKLAERLRRKFEQTNFTTAGHQTASFGVAEHLPGHTPNQIFRQADQALYLAKKKGCNRVEPQYKKDTDNHD